MGRTRFPRRTDPATSSRCTDFDKANSAQQDGREAKHVSQRARRSRPWLAGRVLRDLGPPRERLVWEDLHEESCKEAIDLQPLMRGLAANGTRGGPPERRPDAGAAERVSALQRGWLVQDGEADGAGDVLHDNVVFKHGVLDVRDGRWLAQGGQGGKRRWRSHHTTHNHRVGRSNSQGQMMASIF